MLLKRAPSNSFDKCGHRAEGQYMIFQRTERNLFCNQILFSLVRKTWFEFIANLH